jgi:hypothetical protein
MRSHRRLVVTDRVIPFLAAFVGLVALAAAVIVQTDSTSRAARMAEELERLRMSVERLTAQAEEVAAALDDGTAEGLLALQERMNRMEEEWAAMPEATALAAAAGADSQAREIDPSWPTENCIPIDTRFVATPNEPIPICQSPVVIMVSAITDDTVLVQGAGTMVENGVAAIPGTDCTVTAFSADIQGFAELRVACR